MTKLKFIAALAFCVSLTPVFAQSLAEKEKFASQEKMIADDVESAAKKCKVTIPVKFDWSTFKDIDFMKNSPAGYCDNVFSAIGSICERSEDALKSVQSKIKSVTCKHSSPHILSLENGELVYGMDVNDSNISDMVRAFLMEKL